MTDLCSVNLPTTLNLSSCSIRIDLSTFQFLPRAFAQGPGMPGCLCEPVASMCCLLRLAETTCWIDEKNHSSVAGMLGFSFPNGAVNRVHCFLPLSARGRNTATTAQLSLISCAYLPLLLPSPSPHNSHHAINQCGFSSTTTIIIHPPLPAKFCRSSLFGDSEREKEKTREKSKV